MVLPEARGKPAALTGGADAAKHKAPAPPPRTDADGDRRDQAGADDADADADADDQDLFAEPPADLLCPITHALFRDPVLAASGHMFERAAIQRHLSGAAGPRPAADRAAAAACPLSGLPLGPPPHALTPVHAARGRAMAQRESVAAECVRRAAGAADLRRCARLLARAAEMLLDGEDEEEEGEEDRVEGAGAGSGAGPAAAARRLGASLARPPGFPPALGQFVLRHGGGGGGSAENANCLAPSLSLDGGGSPALAAKFFADALRAAGRTDAAGAVYARLLLLGGGGKDARAMAEYLALCLACWEEEEATGGDGGGAVGRLADLFSPSSSSSGRRGLLPFSALLGGRADPGVLDLLDRAAAIALCEELIARRCRRASAGGGGGGGGGGEHGAEGGVALAARYARLLADQARARAVEEALGRVAAAAAAGEAAGAGDAGRRIKQPRGRRRIAAAVALTAATLASPAAGPLGMAALHCARLAPLLYLVL